MASNDSEMRKRDHLAQWTCDGQPILDRFHLELLDVHVQSAVGVLGNERDADFFSDAAISFMTGRLERMMTLSMGITALGTRLFGGFGEGISRSKSELNRAKKHADAVSAYTLSEGLWFAARHLPENHAIMVCLGEGLMPKGGETQEMGSNPQLGFGRIYARTQVAKWLEQRVLRLINDDHYTFETFYTETRQSNITIWGAAIDTLENTTRFAKGKPTGPMTVLHLFDQPLCLSRPYEGYMGGLTLPQEIVACAEEQSVLLDFRTPRKMVMQVIENCYPGIKRGNVHVWTLGGENRKKRIGSLWQQWRNAGAHMVEKGSVLNSKLELFTDSGTYAPTYKVGTWEDAQGEQHLFICDGYSATAESMQAATLAKLLGLDVTMVPFTAQFRLSCEREQNVMRLDTLCPEFESQLNGIVGDSVSGQRIQEYKAMILEATSAGFPVAKRILRADDFFPEKHWNTAALVGYMCPDPYTDASGVCEVNPSVYQVATRLTAGNQSQIVKFTLRLTEPLSEANWVYKPLLMRYFSGEDICKRKVNPFDSGRIRNELQTLCNEALEFVGECNIRIHFDRIPPGAIVPKHQKRLFELLSWYKKYHPQWFDWLEIVHQGK